MGLSSSSHADDVADKYTRMTKKQKKAIQKSWKPLTKDRRKHGTRIFVRLFRKYPIYRRYFLDVPGVKMSDLARHPGVLAHCDAFMKSMEKYIEVAIKNPEKLVDLCRYLSQLHVDMAIGESDSQKITDTILEYLISEFPKEMTEYVIDCWKQFFEVLTYAYFTNLEAIQAAEEKDNPIPVHASRKKNRDKEVEDAFWEKHREYWSKKIATWDDTNAKSIEIDDEEHEDSYIGMRNKKSRCCGISPIFGGKEKNYPSSEKPAVGKEITEPRSSTTVNEVRNDLDKAEGAGLPTVNSRRSVAYSNVSSDVSRSLLDEYSTSEIMNSEPYPLDVRTRRSSLSPKNKERRLTELYSIQDLPNAQSSKTPSYVPGRNIDDMDIPMPPCFKKERKDKQSHSVTFDSDTRVYADYSLDSVADGPRERRRKWNEFTSCCNKRYSYY